MKKKDYDKKDRAAVLRNRKKMYKNVEKSEKAMARATDKVFDEVLDILHASGLTLNQATLKKIVKSFKGAEPDLDKVASALSATIISATKQSIKERAGLLRVRLSNKRLNQIVNEKLINLSPRLHSTNRLVRKVFYKQLKYSIKAGESMVKTAKRLLDVEKINVNLPKYIAEMQSAAKRAIRYQTPEAYAQFRKTLSKHEKYIDNLTRAGEKGYEQLGIRGGTRKFKADLERMVKDIENATAENVDNLVNIWKEKKAKYYQRRVARSEANDNYIKYNREYMEQSDFIIGLERHLSSSHPTEDPCDDAAGKYYYGKDEMPPRQLHPNDLCYETAIVDPEILKAA